MRRAVLLGSLVPLCLPAFEEGWHGGPAIIQSIPSGKFLRTPGDRQLALNGSRVFHPLRAERGS